MNTIPYAIAGFNGESWVLPAAIEESYWATLGAGADTLCLSVFLTSDHQMVCAPSADLSGVSSEYTDIGAVSFEQLVLIDVCEKWRSQALDSDGQPIGEWGGDTPWRKNNSRSLRSFLKLERVLQLFSRRAKIILLLPGDDYALLQVLCEQLHLKVKRFSLAKRAMLIAEEKGFEWLQQTGSDIPVALDIRKKKLNDDTASNLRSSHYSRFFANCEQVIDSSLQSTQVAGFLDDENIKWVLASSSMRFTPSKYYLYKLLSINTLETLIVGSVSALKENLIRPGLIYSDGLQSGTLDQAQWAAGYSHNNNDTDIRFEKGVVIDIKEGGEYSGGAVVSKLPTYGEFDVRVSYSVASPHQGTTFELAAITIEPSYKSVNLCFDVHGAPPYASSERDEDDGKRCGWNNGFSTSSPMLRNLDIQNAVSEPEKEKPKKILWGEAYSSNMYNCYGRDVGYGGTEHTSGELRLTRRGDIFTTYYRDYFNKSWVCSGCMLVQSMPSSVHFRLAAKHWKKKNPAPPGNKVTFRDFYLYQD
ncbi:hypothetical protein [Teredinibacter haidensis]|uniref:hypothetical protein n=1 Tax=Teredinibacter haidensis TaxID=2731755 RepID=UPI000948E242|nr:hypothetical protein [Teredinibacter haidensis]